MAVLDDLEAFVKDNTLDGSWYKANLRARCADFLEDEALVVPTGTLPITENGTVDVTNYASASVSVVPTGTISITENGDVDVTNYATASVEVSGGSSDFSTAQMTIVNNGGTECEGSCTYITTNPMFEEALDSYVWVDAGDTETFEVVLYKNKTFISFDGFNASVTGGAELDGDLIRITGDCTITLTGGK